MPDPTPTPPGANVRVTKANSAAINRGIVAAMMGEPGPAPDQSSTPPPVVPPVQSSEPPVPPVQPTEAPKGPAPIPDALFSKAKSKFKPPAVAPIVPPQPGSEDLTPDTVKVDDYPEAHRPNVARLRDKWRGTEKLVAEKETNIKRLMAEVDELKKKSTGIDPVEHTKVLDTLAKVRLEADPRFVAKWNRQVAPVEQTVKSVLASYEVADMKVDEVVNFLRKIPAKERPAFLASQLPEEVAPSAIATLLPMLGQLDIIENTRLAEIAQHQQTVQLLDKDSVDEQNRIAAAGREAAKREALKRLGQEEMLLQKIDGNEEWNRGVDALMAGVQTVFDANDPVTHAEALIQSRLTPVYREMFFMERMRREALEGALRARNIVLPDVGNSAPPAPDAQSPVPTTMTSEEAVRRVSAGIRSRSS